MRPVRLERKERHIRLPEHFRSVTFDMHFSIVGRPKNGIRRGKTFLKEKTRERIVPQERFSPPRRSGLAARSAFNMLKNNIFIVS